MNRQTGFALLIVLTTMAFLSLLGTQLLAAARSDTRLADDLRTDAVLEAAADGAVAHVVFAMRAARDPDFRPDGIAREVRIGPTPVIVRVWNESDRVNLNTAPAPLLRALVVGVGAEASVADQVAAAILDWRTKGANPTDGAARTQRYRLAGFSHAPPGTNFKTVLDLNDVLGMTPALFARLAPHVTVWTTDDPDMTTRDPGGEEGAGGGLADRGSHRSRPAAERRRGVADRRHRAGEGGSAPYRHGGGIRRLPARRSACRHFAAGSGRGGVKASVRRRGRVAALDDLRLDRQVPGKIGWIRRWPSGPDRTTSFGRSR